mmetsp:Transcript_27376/g.45924  ORF Transcript_27376/g.45924 Transcript_27376/m.45924 type:complete len:235 (+) Transcript_27376:855-1559(+)
MPNSMRTYLQQQPDLVPQGTLLADLDAARTKASSDARTMCSIYGVMADDQALLEEHSYTTNEECGDSRITLLCSPLLNLEHLSSVPQAHRHHLLCASDGSDQTAAMVVFRPPAQLCDDRHSYLQDNLPPPVLASAKLHLPEHIGTTRTRSYDTEMVGALLALRTMLHERLGSLVIDNQSIMHHLSIPPPHTLATRLFLAQGRTHLHCTTRHATSCSNTCKFVPPSRTTSSAGTH